MVQSKDGVRHTMRCGNRCIYNLLKAFGWSLVLLLAISYVFLFLTVTHSIHTPSSVPLWYLIYLVVFFVGGFYMAIDISEILFWKGVLTFHSDDELWGIRIILLLTILGTFMAIPLGIAYLFFSRYVQDILLFYFAPPLVMFLTFIVILLIKILGACLG